MNQFRLHMKKLRINNDIIINTSNKAIKYE